MYVSDLVFFGGSYTTRPERGERFQAKCVARVMEAKGEFSGAELQRVCWVLHGGDGGGDDCGGESGGVWVQERLRELVGYTFFKPPPLGWLASCFLLDFIEEKVSESSLGIVENWFNSEYAVKIGKDEWDVKKVRAVLERARGGVEKALLGI
ncbi:hypothetical protein JHK87_040353 [Glycine soja]|nr:hypothetical protein JHK87_040353 [Glycine soja]